MRNPKSTMSRIGDLQYERQREDKVTDGILFDHDGITAGCPRAGLTTFDECERCPYHLGHEGFRVFCSYGSE